MRLARLAALATLALALLAAPLAAEAQPQAKVYRLGFFRAGLPGSVTAISWTPSGRVCANWGTWRGGTSRSSIGGRKGSTTVAGPRR